MKMLKTMGLKSGKKFLSSMIAASILCMTPSSLQFCQDFPKNAPQFLVGEDCTVSKIKEKVDKVITFEDVSFKMVFVEGGTFWMGAQTNSDQLNYDPDADDDESPVHSVTLSDYYIGETEVTQELWFTVMTGSYTDGDKTMPNGYSLSSGYGLGANYPVYYVHWNNIVGTEGDDHKYYDEKGVRYYEDGFCYRLSVLANGGSLGSRRYSLPTEAEWEYAARGGNKSQGYKYSGSNTVSEVARYGGSGTQIVRQKKKNELGLYDMSGNILEVCADVYDSYGSENVTDPINVGTRSSSSYVLRGGCFSSNCDGEAGCRVSKRKKSYTGAYFMGFRVRCRF